MEYAAVSFVSHFGSAGGRASSPMHACSACAGDYEDPDRTARAAESNDEPREEVTQGPDPEEFPAGR